MCNKIQRLDGINFLLKLKIMCGNDISTIVEPEGGFTQRVQ